MLLIKNGRIITMESTDFDCGYILVEDGKIKDIGSMDKFNELKIGESCSIETVIDAQNNYVLPGFIDAHCHVGMWEDSVGFEGDDGNEMTDPVTPHLRAIDGVYHMDRAFIEAREAGVTTVVTGPGSANVLGGQFVALKTYGRSVDEMVLKEPAALKAAFGENPKTVYNEKRQTPMTRMATAALLRENLAKAKEYKNMLDDYKNDPEENDKPEYDIKMEALLKIINKEVPLKAHAHRADDILTAIRIAKEFDIKVTIEHCTEGYMIKELLLEEGVGVCLGPLLTDRSKIELRNQNIKSPALLSNAGIDVAITTDHPCVPIQHLSLSAAVAVKAGMDEKKALQSITINAAKITGIEDRVGSLSVGKDADIVIFDGNPLDLKTNVLTTIINGVPVYERENNEKL
ncbi:MAG TPA: amidohydrolase [Pseudobacteroides sp.]|nr:amidohydrolase [Pseudobacteroides sp.]